MNTPQCSRPELLAPAGSRESFHAAVDSGADAVYLGLADFNARLRAKNFTTRDLSSLVPFAHSRNVKVYVTLNTLIKQNEIASALNVLYQLDQLGVDAVIAADIGLMRLSANNFPKLRIHGSTQAAVHNAYGAEFLKSLGVKRAVLARELSLEEIEETAKASPIETEVFIHGALCYSMSGMCLASSFIGGASGNRGRCTQVCRRRFKRDGRIKNSFGIDGIDTDKDNIDTADGYFFSPNDLQALPFIDRLVKAGVACFKIEGRMKGAEYVSTVVKAYRHAIDFPDDIDYAEKMLRFDFGRAKTVFFMDGRRGEAIDPKRSSGTGIFLGTVAESDGGAFSIKSINNINADDTLTIEKNDRLRIHPKDGFEGIACKAASCQLIGDNDDRRIKITPSQPIKCTTGDSVFLIGKASINTDVNTSINNNSINTIVNIKPTYPAAKRIADSLTPRHDPDSAVNQNPAIKPTLWFKADRLQWLDFLTATPCQRLIFDADLGELESLINSHDVVKIWRSRISVALPPFIEELKLALWRGIVEKCLSVGLRSFTVSNVGHFPLVKGAERIISDSLLWCLNRFTQVELSGRGVSRFIFSWEDEYLNIRDSVYPPPVSNAISGVAPIYGRPPLFISRIKPPLPCGETAVDPHGGAFFVSTKNDLCYTLPKTPVCLFAKRKKLSECGVNDFLIDLSFHEPSYELMGALMSGYKQNIRIDGSTIFNFKAGLK
ncbi:MAG: U32 family peptidase [Chitinispirillales bacterium]|jgi:putative protease|nr:U32 family peptidase [Chitinispirillales bacterium]